MGEQANERQYYPPQANYKAELEHDDNSTQHTDDSLGTAIDKPPVKNR
jgi:hypothetical protein